MSAPSDPAAVAQIDGYLADLAGRLRGPRRRREQILAEIRDGLDHALADHAAAGLPAEHAAAAAVVQFGRPRRVADAFAGELATAYARRTIAWFIATGPVVGVWWLLLLRPQPWRTGLVALLAAIPVIPLIVFALLTAAGMFATTGSLMRWLPETGPQRALTCTITVATLALAADLTVVTIAARSVPSPRSLAVVAVTASVARAVCSLLTIRRAADMRRHAATVHCRT